MQPFTILHLSDIHFKKSEADHQTAFRENVHNKIIAAVEMHCREYAPPDFVVITGDIAFTGKKADYQTALPLVKKLRGKLPEGTPILPVPGNHDVDRTQVEDLFSLREKVMEGKGDKVVGSRIKRNKVYLHSKFKDFKWFCRQVAPTLYQEVEAHIRAGIKGLDDERDKEAYFWVSNFEKQQVSFLGLNSSWACEGDKDQMNIALGFPQVTGALDLATQSTKIILMHHPPADWLTDMKVGDKCRKELLGNCSLLLHGHTHTDSATYTVTPSTACIVLGAKASWTHDGGIGCQFIDVSPSEGDVRLKIWPYKLFEDDYRFDTDYGRWAGQGGKAYFIMPPEEKETSGHPIIEFEPEIPLVIPEDYKQWLTEFHSQLSLDQLAKKGEALLVDLPEVYIPLLTSNPFYKPPEHKEKEEDSDFSIDLDDLEIEEDTGQSAAVDKNGEPALIDVEELVGRVDCLLLRGRAGMGKTTIIKHLAYRLSHGTAPRTLENFLPVLVFLKDLWPIYRHRRTGADASITLESLLPDYLKKIDCPLPYDIVKAFLAAHRALVLLDGLDEVPEVIRPHLIDMLHRFQFGCKGNRFLITGRPHGIEGRG
ncbi:MAG: NACHT domain-containing protein, partial [bacterium]|nr:NACHT domain-containing protein [bacterium]